MLNYVQDLNLLMYFVSLLRKAAGSKDCGVSHPLGRCLQAVSRTFRTGAHLSELLRRTLGEKTLKESNSLNKSPAFWRMDWFFTNSDYKILPSICRD